MSNNNRLRNGFTGNWLRGNTNVYRIFNPNHSASYLVNKNSLFKYVESNRIRSLKNLNALITRLNRNATTGVLRGPFRWYREFNAGEGTRGPNILYNTANKNRINGQHGVGSLNAMAQSLGRYQFNKFVPGRGRVKIREPRYGANLKLLNVKPNKLTNENKRTLRHKKRQNAQNEAAQEANRMRRARNNAAERARLSRQQNERAAQHIPQYLWYNTRNLDLINANGQSYGRRNIPDPYWTPLRIRGTGYVPLTANILPQNMREARQRVINRFGWGTNSTVFYVRNTLVQGIMGNAFANLL